MKWAAKEDDTQLVPRYATEVGPLRRNVKRFLGGLVFKAHRLLYHSTLGLRIIKKKKKVGPLTIWRVQRELALCHHRKKVTRDWCPVMQRRWGP